MAAPIISIRGLHKWYSGVHALNGIDLDIQSGEPVGLVGDNGAGKSTFIKVLSGVERPDTGEIRVEGNGLPIRSPKSAMRLGIETVYQYNSMVPNMTVSRNLFIGREPLVFSAGGIGVMNQQRCARTPLEQSRTSTFICDRRIHWWESSPAASVRASLSPARCISSRRF